MKGVANTAFYCCGVRMLDMERAEPICGDRYAERFMTDHGRAVFEQFGNFKYPNGSNIARARIIDDILRSRLAADTDVQIILIGAGFDSRAYRLNGGHWIELDDPGLIDFKNERLPVTECANPLTRIPIDFTRQPLREVLAKLASDRQSLIVAEGVFVYLAPHAITELIASLHRLLPDHELICDLMQRRFLARYSRAIHDKIAALGAEFRYVVDEPAALFLDSGYRIDTQISVVSRASDLGAIDIPGWLLRYFLRTLATGYRVYVLRPSVQAE